MAARIEGKRKCGLVRVRVGAEYAAVWAGAGAWIEAVEADDKGPSFAAGGDLAVGVDVVGVGAGARAETVGVGDVGVILVEVGVSVVQLAVILVDVGCAGERTIDFGGRGERPSSCATRVASQDENTSQCFVVATFDRRRRRVR